MAENSLLYSNIICTWTLNNNNLSINSILSENISYFLIQVTLVQNGELQCVYYMS